MNINLQKIDIEDAFGSKDETKGIVFKTKASIPPKDIDANHIVDNIYTARVNYNQLLSLKNNENIIELELAKYLVVN